MTPVITHHPSPNCDARPPGAPIDTIILHYTGMLTAGMALRRMCDPAAKVSAHYMIERNGTILQLVDDGKRAWHAGQSAWRGRAALNDTSIGVELVNRGHQWCYQEFPPAQIAACIALVQILMQRHGIPAHNILAHSDIAPDRKEDPGEKFPWRELARHGIGLWRDFKSLLDAPIATPTGEPPADHATVRVLLRQIGYECPPGSDYDPALRRRLLAFQRHWYPENLSGLPDPGTLALLQLYAAANA